VRPRHHRPRYDRPLVALPGVGGVGELVDWRSGRTADFAEEQATVALTITDASGQEVAHAFQLARGQPSDR
jgi:hypothetical protein